MKRARVNSYKKSVGSRRRGTKRQATGMVRIARNIPLNATKGAGAYMASSMTEFTMWGYNSAGTGWPSFNFTGGSPNPANLSVNIHALL